MLPQPDLNYRDSARASLNDKKLLTRIVRTSEYTKPFIYCASYPKAKRLSIGYPKLKFTLFLKLFTILTIELLYPTSRVDNFLLTCIKWVAG